MSNRTRIPFNALCCVLARLRPIDFSRLKTPQTYTGVGKTAILGTISKRCSKGHLPDLRTGPTAVSVKEPLVGFEPTTCSLRMSCSTPELQRLMTFGFAWCSFSALTANPFVGGGFLPHPCRWTSRNRPPSPRRSGRASPPAARLQPIRWRFTPATGRGRGTAA